MKQIKIEGGIKLSGTINVGGAKNSAVALVPASILSDEEIVIDNIPEISDIDALDEILEYQWLHSTVRGTCILFLDNVYFDHFQDFLRLIVLRVLNNYF